ncbi:pachytene checkpoint protein 2 homolog [Agrilus planipennis]|uniref:Pachytene checkpoint protein 2 homolog n=1 Tax=Agrilus planipennis TaxID=224129 RepID=A0A7F5R2I7_AGRPL|nr:pachytene checkpoint protein 2 homolog [Agrilus planipennis]XP_025829583.1 pachytene checkpoint protein 2 homolog [Agrilus planipennis]
MLFADRNVDDNLISCNKVILLHGPPGTGKTSLSKALAQKLSIRLQSRFIKGILIEINSHSLFSKWFSESGKLVSKMFSQIRDFVEDQKFLVCILIDEVESLAHAREKCMSGNEPSDSIRVVNALLTELDKIKIHSNVLIFATSNVTGAIDLAFIDRADIKEYIGLPGVQAIYQIYYSCIQELLKAEIIQPKVIIQQCPDLVELESSDIYKNDKKLLKISEASVGLSGRSVRKLPFIAHALFLQTEIATLENYLEALLFAVEYQKTNSKYF